MVFEEKECYPMIHFLFSLFSFQLPIFNKIKYKTMLKVKIYVFDTHIEFRSNSKVALVLATEGLLGSEIGLGIPLMAELFHVHSPDIHMLIGEYDSVKELRECLEAIPTHNTFN